MTKRYHLVLAGLLILALALAGPVTAADIAISPGAGAIQAAVNSAADGATIVLGAGTYSENNITITAKNLTFRAADGHGPTDTIIDGTGVAPRIFTVTDTSLLTIVGLTLQNGRAADGAAGAAGVAGGAGENGGAISSSGPVALTSMAIINCSAGPGGTGGSSATLDGATGGTGGSGGAVSTTGAVTLTTVTITNCSAGKGGNGGSTTAGGYKGAVGGPGGSGGAVSTTGAVTLTSSTIAGCSAGPGGTGGSAVSSTGGNGGTGGSGGAVSAAGGVTADASTITGCSAGNGGSGGSGGERNSGGNGGSGGAVSATGTVTFTSGTITGCSAGAGGIAGSGTYAGSGGNGGAVSTTGSVSITTSTLASCLAGNAGSGTIGTGGRGGAVYTTGSVSITSSTFTGCSAGTSATIGNGFGGNGGAIYAGASSTVTSSTFTGCTAGSINGPGCTGGHGGAIYTGAESTVSATTFTGCSAGSASGVSTIGGSGGAIYAGANLNVTSGTITGCAAGTGETRGTGGAVSAPSGTIRLSRLVNDNTVGKAVAGTGAGISAPDNWWGTNDPSSLVSGTVVYSPWRVLGVTASPSLLGLDQSSVIRANLTFNSTGADASALGLVPAEGLPIAFSVTGGSIQPAQGNLSSNANTTLFTPVAYGIITVNATVDGQSVSVPVSVHEPFRTLNPGDSIQQNITDSLSGDIIILNPGRYPEHDIVVSKDITIRANTSRGGTAATTIIDAANAGRVFDNSGGYALSLDNLSLQNGQAAVTGGGIYSTGTVTATSVKFSRCSAKYGGAIGGGGTVTVNSSTFSLCSADYGGAIDNDGTLSIVSSQFLTCGAAYGGIISVNGNTAIHFSRFTGNTGTLVQNNGDTADATDNWWGSDADPAGLVSSDVTVSPWLVLGATATPSTITPDQSSGIRANLTYNSAGDDTSGTGTLPDGIPVTFTGTGGGLQPAAGKILSGANMTAFTPAGAGTSTVSVKVDSQTISVPVITVPSAPVTNFTAIPLSGATPLTVRFTDTSTNTPTAWKWTFGDGSSVNSTQRNPVHTYLKAGNYTVALRATNAGGNTTMTVTDFITGTPSPAPAVNGIQPVAGTRGAVVRVTNLSGTGFAAGATVYLNKTGSSLITATNLTVVNAKRIICTLRIPATAAVGPWSIRVRNTDGKVGMKANAFTVKSIAAPTVTGIQPGTGQRGTTVTVTNLSGTGFVGTDKPTVQLTKTGQTPIMATNVTVVSPNRITCKFPIGATTATGLWNVRVTNADKQAGTKAWTFTVTA
jgi:PKD repeat protein